MSRRGPRAVDERPSWPALGLLAFHLVPLLAIFTGVTWTSAILCLVLFSGRGWFITAGFHRYFSHRSYRIGRVGQFLLAFGGTSAAQHGPLWWASHHRIHHRFTEGENDPHSPSKGLLWSHMGWVVCAKHQKPDRSIMKDFSKYPELVFLDRFDWLPPLIVALACFAIAGWSGVVVGFFLSTVMLFHATFTVNSVAHVWGRRRFATEDTSRNSMFVALLAGGEGWHNNHHRYAASARQGFYWWEIDPTYYTLVVLRAIGIVSDMRLPPASVLEEGRRGERREPALTSR